MPRLLALCLALVACQPEEADPPPAPEEPVSLAVRPGVGLDRILAPRDDDAALLARLRPARSASARPVANEYVAGQVDSVRTYVYDGLVLDAYEVSGGRSFVQRVAVTGGDYGTADGLAVGETRADLEAVLGAPARGGRVSTYDTGSGPTPTLVEVTYEPDESGVDRAVEVVWRPYLD